MIFALAQKEPTIFLMLSHKDIQTMREGRTVFVDDRQLGGGTFNRVLVCVNKTDKDSIKMIQKHGQLPQGTSFDSVQPKANEEKCSGCDGCIAPELLFEGKCMVCWATLAKKLQVERNKPT